jgi:4-hydroxyproline epimerase
MERIHVVDSHTAGEPTRVVIAGGPEFSGGDVSARRADFSGRFDRYRSAVVNEPRGSDVLVGAWLVPATTSDAACGVIFFNNVGMLGMCGHGLIGVVATLAHLGRIGPGRHLFETAVGTVAATLLADGRVALENVESFRQQAEIRVSLPGGQTVQGDLAWGGNWFLLVSDHGLAVGMDHVEALTELAWSIRTSVNANGYPEVDHIELFGPPSQPGADSKSFVLCPGKAYDRSPCGTGTSAKLACLAARGELAPGEIWMQESIVGTTFEASYRWSDEARGVIVPTIVGRAYITGEATLLLDPNDPFCHGIRGGK